MKKIAAILALLTIALQAYAVQEVKLTETPPLQPVHWCKFKDGHTMYQNEPCESSDAIEVSSIKERQPDGSMDYSPLNKQDASTSIQPSVDTSTAKPASSATEMSPEEKKQIMKDFRIRMAKWLGFALVVALIAKLLLKRSFILWFIIGFVLRMVLVAANVIAF